MGHHAQYRKRFSTNTGSVYPLSPPTNANWDVRWGVANIQAQFTVDTPAPATALKTELKPVGGEWFTGLGGTIKNSWFAIEAGSPSGNYLVRSRWCVAATGFTPLSDWSAYKAVTIP